MSDVVLDRVAKHYGATVAVESMSLRIGSGELVALLGPSGCGKTTTLRMVGGFVPLSSGLITVGGRDVSALPPSRRNMGFVFQNYALFPHMTVAQNVAFGLEMRKLGRAEIETRVTGALERVRLGAFRDRYPRQLSGGQQQRVALARALVVEPDVLLLDEPLSNLDASLRQEMKIEIRQLQQALGLTTIFVTHDQDEAMSTADRMVLMHRGRVEQAGPPAEVYSRPRSAFAAGFLGVANLVPGRMTRMDTGSDTGRGDGFVTRAGPVLRLRGHRSIQGDCVLALRGEEVTLRTGQPAGDENALSGRVALATFHGVAIEYHVETEAGLRLVARVPAPGVGGPEVMAHGAEVLACWAPDAGVLVAET
ncbi:ABC transporter ATP-binding protein [Pseudodonghicola xiamenensis]|uniref:ABC transporter ATP-binding protein n=1 Tax=Pseudodonghicola xiamenensis TaxID=337702 RepID=A0A8J3HAK8_9RHOB|nr:ABC transporter ATP-binding protein [Pseudodonghicola xiamenensis]GHG98117.1 ABC transporter ATP-binding protein [Pseudodonghicola xiamenensis]